MFTWVLGRYEVASTVLIVPKPFGGRANKECPFSGVTNSGRVRKEGARKRCSESLSLSVSVVSVFVCLSLSLCLSVSLSQPSVSCLSVSLCLCVSVSLSFSLSFSLSGSDHVGFRSGPASEYHTPSIAAFRHSKDAVDQRWKFASVPLLSGDRHLDSTSTEQVWGSEAGDRCPPTEGLWQKVTIIYSVTPR